MEGSNATEAVKKTAPKLPISKVKRIAKADPDYIICSQSATAALAFATELFVQVFSEEGLAKSQLDRPAGSRLTLRYDDLASCVATSDRFAFLSDVIPETQSLVSLTRENRVRYTTLAPGQAVLPFRAREEQTNSDVDNEEEPEVEMEAELDVDDENVYPEKSAEAEAMSEEELESEHSIEEEEEKQPLVGSDGAEDETG